MHARSLLVVGIAACLAVALAGCSSTDHSHADTARRAVQGTWVLDHRLDTAEVPYVAFNPDRSWSASDGCTRVYGTWRIAGDHRLSIITGPHAQLTCAGRHLVTTVIAADTARVPRGTDQLHIASGSTTITLDRSTRSVVGPQQRPVGYWLKDHSDTSPYLSLRADDSFRLDDGCSTTTGTWKFSTTEEVRLYPDPPSGTTCASSTLARSARGRISGNTMTLTASDGTVTAELHRFER